MNHALHHAHATRSAVHSGSAVRYLIVTLLLVAAYRPAHGQSSPATDEVCSDEQKQQAKQHFLRAREHSQHEQPTQAIKEYKLALALCPRPVIVYNIAGVYWNSGMKSTALDEYASYLKLRPDGPRGDFARGQFFALAEEFHRQGQHSKAIRLYKQFLRLDPTGEKVATARARLTELGEDDEVARSTTKESERHTSHDTKRHRPRTHQQPAANTRRQRALRIGFWSAAGATVASLAAVGIMGLQVRALENDKYDAVVAYQEAARTQLDMSDACFDASSRLANGLSENNSGSELLATVADTCARGRSRALAVNLATGAAALSAAAAGYLLYKAYFDTDQRGAESNAVSLAPTVSPTVIGGHMTMRF